MRKLFTILAINIIISTLYALTPEKYYVSADGDDTNPGNSPSAPWKTIDKAINHNYQTGDDVYFCCGDTFTPSNSFNITWEGTGDDPVVVGAYYMDGENVIHGVNEDGKPIINGNNYRVPENTCYGSVNSWRGLFHANSKDHIHIKDVHLYKSGFYGISVEGDLTAGTNSSFFLIQNVKVEGAYNSGIIISRNFINNGIIENSEISGAGYGWKTGCLASPPAGINVAHSPFANTIIRNNFLFEVWGPGIILWTNSNALFKNHGHVVIEDNVIWNVRDVGIYVEKSENVIVRRNLCLGAGPDVQNKDFFFSSEEGRGWNRWGIRVNNELRGDNTGIASSYLKNIEITNNLIANYRTGFGLASEHQAGGRVMENIYIYNNTFIGNYYNISIGQLLSDYSMSNVKFINNISFCPAEDFSSDFDMEFSWLNKITWDYNAWSTGRTYVNGNNDVITGSDFVKSLGWQALTEVISAEKFSLTSGSSTIDAGADLSALFNRDYFLTARPQGFAWDIGAIEYSPEVNVESFMGTSGFFHLYPNPASGQVTIEFEITETAIVNITIYNIIGKKILCLLNKEMIPGIYKKSFELKGMSDGIFIVRLSQGAWTETIRVAMTGAK